MQCFKVPKFQICKLECVNVNSRQTCYIKQQYVECRIAHTLASCPLARYLGKFAVARDDLHDFRNTEASQALGLTKNDGKCNVILACFLIYIAKSVRNKKSFLLKEYFFKKYQCKSLAKKNVFIFF